MSKNIKVITAYIYSILSLTLAACVIGWIILITEGTIANGHIPTYGDIETISFDGWDRAFVGYSLTFIFFGGLAWLIATLLYKKVKWVKLNRTIYIVGLISLIINTLIILSPCLTWALD